MNKILKIFGIQKAPRQRSLQEIEQGQCEHEWIDLGKTNMHNPFDHRIYCPKCNINQIVDNTLVHHLVEMSKLRRDYLERIEFDVLDERISQLEMEMKKNDN